MTTPFARGSRPGPNPPAYLVGTGGAAATEMLVDGDVKDTGLVIPERLDPASYLRRLREKGVEPHEETLGP